MLDPEDGRRQGRVPDTRPRPYPHSPKWKDLSGRCWGAWAARLTCVPGRPVALGPEPSAALTGLTGNETLVPAGGMGRGGDGRGGSAHAQPAALGPLRRLTPVPRPGVSAGSLPARQVCAKEVFLGCAVSADPRCVPRASCCTSSLPYPHLGRDFVFLLRGGVCQIFDLNVQTLPNVL